MVPYMVLSKYSVSGVLVLKMCVTQRMLVFMRHEQTYFCCYSVQHMLSGNVYIISIRRVGMKPIFFIKLDGQILTTQNVY